jgi:hypothetical protein
VDGKAGAGGSSGMLGGSGTLLEVLMVVVDADVVVVTGLVVTGVVVTVGGLRAVESGVVGEEEAGAAGVVGGVSRDVVGATVVT